MAHSLYLSTRKNGKILLNFTILREGRFYLLDAQIMKQLADSIEKLGNKFDDFGNRLTKIETMFTMFDRAQNNLSNKVEDIDKVATEAHASTKAAHKRLDGIDSDIDRIAAVDGHEQRIAKLEKVVFWAATTIIGAVILAVMALLFTK